MANTHLTTLIPDIRIIPRPGRLARVPTRRKEVEALVESRPLERLLILVVRDL
jgi:hypothetical protein